MNMSKKKATGRKEGKTTTGKEVVSQVGMLSNKRAMGKDDKRVTSC